MAPVIWGLDLKEIQWGKFKSSYMWNSDYHLRRSRFIIYQLAMILCVVSESLGTAALSDYVDQQEFVARYSQGRESQYNDDYVGIGSYNIFTGVFVATIFGAAFFFDLFWPERHESKSVRLAWKICAVLACVFATADVIALTVITVSKRAYVTGANAAEAEALLRQYHGYNLVYKHNGRALAAMIFLWLGWPWIFVSTWIMWVSQNHDDVQGPWSTHTAMARNGAAGRDVEQSQPPFTRNTQSVPLGDRNEDASYKGGSEDSTPNSSTLSTKERAYPGT